MDAYLQRRQEVMEKEEKLRAGSDLELTPDEVKVNKILMYEKSKVIERSMSRGENFPPAMYFLDAKQQIEECRVFKIIRRMPKGASLHLHNLSLPSIDWVVKNVTYRPDCYIGTSDKGDIRFCLRNCVPDIEGYEWRLVFEARKTSGNAEEFDKMLHDTMSMEVKNPLNVYVNNSDAWKTFSRSMKHFRELTGYIGVTRDWLNQIMTELHEDNVMYAEIRSGCEVYDDEGNMQWVYDLLKGTIQDFCKANPQFLGVKFIASFTRTDPKEKLQRVIAESLTAREKYPDLIVGLDISGDEDKGPPTRHFLEELLNLPPPSAQIDLPLYLHAGETDWTCTYSDGDLFDAVLLGGAKRIGHGTALHSHPELLRIIKDKDIAIEVNPISNQVLRLVRDLRLHPAVRLLAENYPVVISSDNPAQWGALPASHDYYAAFMALGGAAGDLKLLKQLIMNSIQYSAMNKKEKEKALMLWKSDWDTFISKTVETYWEEYAPLV